MTNREAYENMCDELEQYQEIGAVEECKELASIVNMAEKEELAKIIDEWLLYSKIGTVEECQEAVEKRKAMAVNEVHVDEYFCPSCGAENMAEQGMIGDHYCPNCGQAIQQKQLN